MFGVSLPELIVVFVVVLLVFGPDKLPEIARSFGKWTGELRRTSDSLRREFYHSVYNPVSDVRREVNDFGRNLITAKEPAQEPAAPTASPPPAPADPSKTET